ncbi:MAG: glycosyltransferase [Paenibacillaceae bacterium]|nr:glycosyltransferase [Paenibacillaceae bacterium]
MKITVILPLHNSEKYIKECMDSIINQTLQEIEIICIDSGSDATSNIIGSYAENDRRVHYLYDSNSSYGYKINKGISLAQGTYIAIVESDDYIRSDMLQILYETAEKYQVDFIKADYKKFIDIGGRRIESEFKHLANQSRYNCVINVQEEPEIRYYVGYSIWAGLYQKDFLISNHLYLNETQGASYQDTGFSVLATLLSKKVYFSDHQLYHYRLDNNNSSVKSQKKYSCIIDEFCWLKKQMQLNHLNGEDFTNFYKNKKLISYFWNYKRLLLEFRKKFIEEIHEEMEFEFGNEDSYFKTLNYEQVREVKILCGDIGETHKFDQDRTMLKKDLLQIAKIFREKEEIVIFGAGKYGEDLAELNYIFLKGNVVAICDNDINKINREVRGLLVEEPKETVLKHKNAFYVIANRHKPQEILDQLRVSGISPDSVYLLQRMPEKAALLETILELHEDGKKDV